MKNIKTDTISTIASIAAIGFKIEVFCIAPPLRCNLYTDYGTARIIKIFLGNHAFPHIGCRRRKRPLTFANGRCAFTTQYHSSGGSIRGIPLNAQYFPIFFNISFSSCSSQSSFEKSVAQMPSFITSEYHSQSNLLYSFIS